MDNVQQQIDKLQIDELLKQAVKNAFRESDVPSITRAYIKERLDSAIFQNYVKAEIDQQVENLKIGNIINDNIEKKTISLMAPYVKRITTEARERVDEILVKEVAQHVKEVAFPEASIQPSAINWSEFQLNVDQVQGAKELAQTAAKEFINGTFDSATKEAVAINHDSALILTTPNDHLEVDIAEVGMLILKRGINTDSPGFKSIVDAVTDKIPPTPPAHIDYSQIKIPDYTSQFVEMKGEMEKSIRLRGHLPQLEVSGEATLSDVLYTTPGTRRVGINTIDPSDALTVWDDEVEVVVGKHKAQEGYIGTRRGQDINIGANNKVGIIIRSDGSVAINKLQLMGRVLEQSNTVPGEARNKGDITLNDNPQIGSPIGWVCLDGLRWSGFGKIEE